MSDRTPGPWSVNNTARWNCKTDHEITYGDDRECICEGVYGEADARLISASPDMLEALEAAIHHIVCNTQEQSDIITMCGKAIEKAKGETA